MATNGNAWMQQSDTHAGEVVRNATAATFGLPMTTHANAISATTRGGGHGVVGDGDFLVSGTGGLGYSVAVGRVVAAGSFALSQGAYVGYNAAAVTGSLAAHSAFIRHDLICYRVQDTDVDASGVEGDSIHVVQGIAASTDPAIPASLGSLVILSRATVPATSGTPTFTDLRPWASAVGGVIICTSTTRPTVRRRSQEIFETDTNRLMVWNGSVWRGVRTSIHVAAGAAAGPFSSQTILSTLNIPDQGCAGTVTVTGNVRIDLSVPTDTFMVKIFDGAVAVIGAIATGLAAQHISVTASVAMAAGAAKALAITAERSSGTGTATVYGDNPSFAANRIDAIFAPST